MTVTLLVLCACAVVAGLVVRAATRMPWRTIAAKAPRSGPYREGGEVRAAVERPPISVRAAALSGVWYAQLATAGMFHALLTLRWDGIAVGLLPIGALGVAMGYAGVELVRPSEHTAPRVRVLARGLLTYGIPLVGFGLLHELVVESASEGASFGSVGAELGAGGVVVATLMLVACRRLD